MKDEKYVQKIKAQQIKEVARRPGPDAYKHDPTYVQYWSAGSNESWSLQNDEEDADEEDVDDFCADGDVGSMVVGLLP